MALAGGVTTPDRRIVIASEVYWPDESGTSHLVTELARAMVAHGEVRVICSTAGPSNDQGVHVERLGRPPVSGQRVARRALAVAARSWRIARAACDPRRAADGIYAVFGPTLLPYLIAWRKPRGARFAIIVHDVYPDAAVAAALIPRGGLAHRLWRVATRYALRKADSCIAIGHDMGELLASIEPRVAGRVTVVPHWFDASSLTPRPRESSRLIGELGIRSRVVLQVAGNLGRTHGVDDLLAAERALRREFTRDDLTILALGGGARQAAFEAAALEPGSLITYGGRRPRAEEADFLAAADLCFVGYAAGMRGVSVPSRTPAILGAGRPILAVTDASSDLGRLVRDEAVGWQVEPGDVNALVAAIREAVRAPERLGEMGRRSRAVAERLEPVQRAASHYVAALD